MNPFFLNSPEFNNWQWRVASRIRRSFEAEALGKSGESAFVEAITQAGGSDDKLEFHRVRDFTVQVESGFVHGVRSRVSFKVGGKPLRGDLGNLLVLGSFVREDRLVWQRVSFLQFRRMVSGGKGRPVRYSFDLNQLALMRSFPPFWGAAGIFKGQHHHLRNLSGMLGGFALLRGSGDFSVLGGQILDQSLAGRSSIRAADLVPAFLSNLKPFDDGRPDGEYPLCPLEFLDPGKCPACRKYLKPFVQNPPVHMWEHLRSHFPNDQALLGYPGSVLGCFGIESFVQAWTSLRLGEIWRPNNGMETDRSLGNCVQRVINLLHERTKQMSVTRNLMTHAEIGLPTNFILPTEPTPSRGPSSFGVLSVLITESPSASSR